MAVLGAGAVVAAGRIGGAGSRPVRGGVRTGGGAWDVARDGADDCGVAPAGRAVRPAARARVPAALGVVGRRRGAWVAGTLLGAATVAASLVAGLLGPVAIAVYAIVLSVPVWIAWYVLVRRGWMRRTTGRLRSREVSWTDGHGPVESVRAGRWERHGVSG